MAVEGDGDSRVVESTLGLGSLVAGVLSFALNKSVGWVIVHILMSWIYVFYACLVHTDEIAALGHAAEADR